MAKQPFTNAGIDSKLKELRSLTGAALQTEIKRIRSGFPAWISSNFSLSPQEQTDLAQIAPPMTDSLGASVANALEFDFQITILKEPKQPQDPTDPLGSKYVTQRKTIVEDHDPIKGYTMTGQIDITIGYRK